MSYANPNPVHTRPPDHWSNEVTPQPYYSCNYEKTFYLRSICALVMCTLGSSLYLTVYYLLDTSQSLSFVWFAIKFPMLSLLSLYVSLRSTQNYVLVKRKYV